MWKDVTLTEYSEKHYRKPLPDFSQPHTVAPSPPTSRTSSSRATSHALLYNIEHQSLHRLLQSLPSHVGDSLLPGGLCSFARSTDTSTTCQAALFVKRELAFSLVPTLPLHKAVCHVTQSSTAFSQSHNCLHLQVPSRVAHQAQHGFL